MKYGKYGRVAVVATEIYREVHDPRKAWEKALRKVGAVKKGCPQSTFLALCSEGKIEGIAPGKYTRSVKNREYAIKAVSILSQNPSQEFTPEELWEYVTSDEIKHNGQMDVVLALWENGSIKR